MPKVTIYDISLLLGEQSVDYPGDPPYRREVLSSLTGGAAYELSRLSLSAHSGTHLDAPSHFIAGGKSIEQFAAADFILPALVVETDDRAAVRPAEVEAAEIRSGDAVLFKTNNSRSGLAASGEFSERWVHVSEPAGDLLLARKVALVGIDYVSIDKFDAPGAPLHQKLLSAGILVLEGIHLEHVPPGRYTLICLPLKLRAEAAPTRAVLMTNP
jgi:arylformamidase